MVAAVNQAIGEAVRRTDSCASSAPRAVRGLATGTSRSRSARIESSELFTALHLGATRSSGGVAPAPRPPSAQERMLEVAGDPETRWQGSARLGGRERFGRCLIFAPIWTQSQLGAKTAALVAPTSLELSDVGEE